MKTSSKPNKPEPAPITMDDIAKRFLNTPPTPHKSADENKKTKTQKSK